MDMLRHERLTSNQLCVVEKWAQSAVMRKDILHQNRINIFQHSLCCNGSTISRQAIPHTYKPLWITLVVVFQKRFGRHDILILGKSPTTWRQHPDMAIAVDWDVQHHFKQTNKPLYQFGVLVQLECKFANINLFCIPCILFHTLKL